MAGEATIQAIELFVALVSVAAVVGLVVRRLAIPYTVALVLLGLLVASLLPHRQLQVTPELVLLVLLPGLVFEAALRIDIVDFRGSFGGIALLAVPGVLISAGVVAVVLNLAAGLPIELGFVVGAMVAATDPVAVISTFKQLGSPRRLATLIESESLFNDGTALVVFAVALRLVVGEVSPAEAIVSMVLTVVISAAIGAIAGFVASRLIASVDDHLIELTLSLAAAYGTYIVADRIHQSGIIATVVAGLLIGSYGRRMGMSERTRDALDTVWEFFAFLVTALVFLLVGLSISVGELLDALPAIGWGVVAILLARALVVYVLLGGASRVDALAGRRRGLPIAWLHVLFWAGLRGAVAMAMALSLPADFPGRELLQEITFGIILFTLLVQGTTIEAVIDRVGAGRPKVDVPAVVPRPLEE
jgi:CPA1 family monovalent cation:H+ antiporter